MRRSALFWGGLAVALIVPLIWANSFQLFLLQKIAFLALAALGLNFVVGYAGQISIGHAGFYAIGAYGSVLLATKLGAPFWLSAPAAIVLTVAVSMLIAAPTLRTRGVYLAMVTLAFGFVVFFMANNWVDLTGGPSGIFGVERPKFFGKGLDDRGYYVLALALFALGQVVYERLVSGRLGRTLLALNSSELGAASLGISPPRWKLIAIGVSAAYTGVAGVLFAHQSQYLNSDSFPFETSILFLVALLLGGMRTRLGPLVGTVILVVYPTLITALSNYQYLILGIVLVGMLLFMPDGLLASFDAVPSALEHEDARPRVFDLPAERTLSGRGLSKHFGGVRAVDGVDVSLGPGRVYGIIGPNGSGKTTLVGLLTGLHVPTAGTVKVDGENLTGLPLRTFSRHGVVRTFQNLQLFGKLDALANVIVGLHAGWPAGLLEEALRLPRVRRTETEAAATARALLRTLGVENVANRPIGDLPLAQQRLVEIARALATEPSILFLDEPAAGLNPSEIVELTNVLRAVSQRGVTLVVVEHHMDLIMTLCDHIYVLETGKLIAQGTPAAIQGDRLVIDAYLGIPVAAE
jgi:branched-chain amino acid transport system permease protein